MARPPADPGRMIGPSAMQIRHKLHDRFVTGGRRVLDGTSSMPDHRPDPCQGGLVLDAVKAWAGSASARRTHGATASLDGVSTRGQLQIMGQDEETGFSGRTKKQATSSCFFVRP